MLPIFPELKINNELPLLQDFLDLRSNVNCMILFCNTFLACVVGKNRWNMQIKHGAKVDAVATVSDEAFALLLLENYWDFMEQVDKKEFYSLASSTRQKRDHRDNEAADQSKTKATGKWTSSWRGSRRYCGWNSEGLLRFNELVAIVKQDRTDNNAQFQQQFGKHLQRCQKAHAKTSKPITAETVNVYRDLDSLGV